MSPSEVATTAASIESTIRDEIPGTSAALKKLAWAIGISVASALANVIPDLVPIVRDVIVPFLPTWLQTWGSTMLTTGALALVSLLNMFAGKDAKKAIATAYVSEPDDQTSRDIKKLYSK